jgi:DNA-binding GntR family transcriptional regulator
MLNMSRTPLRQEIAAVEADGLVIVEGARGRAHNRYILKMLEYIQTAMLLLQPAGRTGSERRETALTDQGLP